MYIKTLVKLTSRAWSLSILAALHNRVPGRQAPLLAATGASRTAFASSLEHLVGLWLLERNPGHGHPLRPEFRLTPEGKEAAELASKIIRVTPEKDELTLLRRSWTVPILALTEAPRRFSSIRSDLGTITDRALSKSLHQLEAQAWLRRDIDLSGRAAYPTYHAINKGIEITQAIDLTR